MGIISTTVRDAFGVHMLAVVVRVVWRTPTASRLYLDVRIEFVGYVNIGHTCVHLYLKFYCHELWYMSKM